MSDQFRTIKRVAHLGERRLALVFDDGQVVVADFAAAAQKGGVFAPLRDEAVFKKVRIARHGRALVWPNDLDFCADGLYLPTKRPPGKQSASASGAPALLSMPAHTLAASTEEFPKKAERNHLKAS
jgi:hypothetical protein